MVRVKRDWDNGYLCKPNYRLQAFYCACMLRWQLIPLCLLAPPSCLSLSDPLLNIRKAVFCQSAFFVCLVCGFLFVCLFVLFLVVATFYEQRTTLSPDIFLSSLLLKTSQC